MDSLTVQWMNCAIGGYHVLPYAYAQGRPGVASAHSPSTEVQPTVFDQPPVRLELAGPAGAGEAWAPYSPGQVNCGPAECAGGQASLEPEEEDMVRRLEARDREVRAHEQSHVAALGPYARGISYSYQMGPDGRLYAVGGSVEVDAGSEATPEATARKAQILRRAALAGGEASAADFAVAASAMRLATQASGRLLAVG